MNKSKILGFEKREGKECKGRWKWERREIKKVKEYKYLGFICQRNGKVKAHVRERMRKASEAMKEIWEIRKRWFGGDIKRRLWLFDMMVWTVMSYEVEVWGWRERKRLEKMQEKYGR